MAFDAIDFSQKSRSAGAEWPFGHDEIRPWYHASAAFLRCGSADLSRATSGNIVLDRVDNNAIMRWPPQTSMNMGAVYREHLQESQKICVVLGATVTNLNDSAQGNRIISVDIADVSGIETVDVLRCVIACGGLETTRLLLVAQRRQPAAFGGPVGPLGRNYMGHISGKLADIVFDDPDYAADYDFIRDAGVFVRRRFTLNTQTSGRRVISGRSVIDFWATRLTSSMLRTRPLRLCCAFCTKDICKGRASRVC